MLLIDVVQLALLPLARKRTQRGYFAADYSELPVPLVARLTAVPGPATDVHVEKLADVGQGEVRILLPLAHAGLLRGRAATSSLTPVRVADVVRRVLLAFPVCIGADDIPLERSLANLGVGSHGGSPPLNGRCSSTLRALASSGSLDLASDLPRSMHHPRPRRTSTYQVLWAR